MLICHLVSIIVPCEMTQNWDCAPGYLYTESYFHIGITETELRPQFVTSNSHDYTAALPCYESISYEIKHRKSFILPILSHKFGMYN